MGSSLVEAKDFRRRLSAGAQQCKSIRHIVASGLTGCALASSHRSRSAIGLSNVCRVQHLVEPRNLAVEDGKKVRHRSVVGLSGGDNSSGVAAYARNLVALRE